MKIFVLHNSKDSIRSQNIIDQFASQEGKWEYEIVEAIMYPSQPSVGISRSFKKCIEIAKKSWHAEIMILEDDFKCLSNNSLETMIKLWNSYALNDGILLGGCYQGELYSIDDENISELIPPVSGLHACIIDESIYDIILQSEEPYNLDYWLSTVKKVRFYVTVPFYVIQQNFKGSNGQDMKHLNEGIYLKYKVANKK